MTNTLPFDRVIGLDRSDRKADLCLLDTPTQLETYASVDTAPEVFLAWLQALRQRSPKAGWPSVWNNRPATSSPGWNRCPGSSSTPSIP